MRSINFRRAHLVVAASCIALLSASGCGQSPGQIGSRAEGVYAVDGWTRTQGHCDSEGDSVIDELQDKFLTLARANTADPDRSTVEVVSCSGDDDCQRKAHAIPRNGSFIAWYTFSFNESRGSSELYGQYATTGSSSKNSPHCTNGELADQTLKILDNGSIRIEERTRIVDQFPKNERGFCSTEGTKAAAKGLPCNRLQIVTARRLGS